MKLWSTSSVRSLAGRSRIRSTEPSGRWSGTRSAGPSAPGNRPKRVSNERFSLIRKITCLMCLRASRSVDGCSTSGTSAVGETVGDVTSGWVTVRVLSVHASSTMAALASANAWISLREPSLLVRKAPMMSGPALASNRPLLVPDVLPLRCRSDRGVSDMQRHAHDDHSRLEEQQALEEQRALAVEQLLPPMRHHDLRQHHASRSFPPWPCAGAPPRASAG